MKHLITLVMVLFMCPALSAQTCGYPITWSIPTWPDPGGLCGSTVSFDSPAVPTPATIQLFSGGILIESVVRYTYTGPIIFDDVPSGPCEITITDADCCTVTVTSGVSLTGTTGANPPMVFDLIGPTTWMLASGGIPYQFEWSNGSTITLVPPIENINLSVTVTNNNGCTHIEPLIDKLCCMDELPVVYERVPDASGCESMKYFLKQYPPFDQGAYVYVTELDGTVLHSDYWDPNDWGGWKGTPANLCPPGPHFWYAYSDSDDCWYSEIIL